MDSKQNRALRCTWAPLQCRSCTCSAASVNSVIGKGLSDPLARMQPPCKVDACWLAGARSSGGYRTGDKTSLDRIMRVVQSLWWQQHSGAAFCIPSLLHVTWSIRTCAVNHGWCTCAEAASHAPNCVTYPLPCTACPAAAGHCAEVCWQHGP
jgi:hypothetical protein